MSTNDFDFEFNLDDPDPEMNGAAKEILLQFRDNMIGEIDEQIVRVRDQWNRAYDRSDERLIGRYGDDLDRLRTGRRNILNQFDQILANDVSLVDLQAALTRVQEGR